MDDLQRKNILKIAEKLFSEQGFRDTSMQQLAQEVGVSVGTLYRHYKSKDEIFEKINRPELREVSLSKASHRQTILEAACDAFGEKGFSRVNVDDIAIKLGKSKTFIYQYFKSKDDLFFACIYEGLQMQKQHEMFTVPRSGQSLESYLTDIGNLLLSTMNVPRNLSLMRIIICESSSFPTIGDQFFHENIEAISSRWGGVVKSVLPPDIDAVLFIRLFCASIWSTVLYQELNTSNDNVYTLEKIVNNTINIFSGGAKGLKRQ